MKLQIHTLVIVVFLSLGLSVVAEESKIENPLDQSLLSLANQLNSALSEGIANGDIKIKKPRNATFSANKKERLGTLFVAFGRSRLNGNYYISDITNYTYDQKSGSGYMTLRASGTGLLEPLNVSEKTYLGVPGANLEGYSKIRLFKRGKQLYLITDYFEAGTNGGAFKHSSQLATVSGNWGQFENGQSVSFDYTDAARERWLDVYNARLGLIFKTAFEDEVKGELRLSNMQLVSAEFHGETKITATPNEIYQSVAPYTYTVKFDVYM